MERNPDIYFGRMVKALYFLYAWMGVWGAENNGKRRVGFLVVEISNLETGFEERVLKMWEVDQEYVMEMALA